MRTVLVADDDSHIRDVICFALRRSGFDVVEAEDGRATLDQFMRHQPDLVILDILMPEMDGLDVCRTIRSRAAAAAQGGNVRVGLEDSLWDGPGQLAESNAAQVTRVRKILEGLSLDTATPDEARSMLSLKGGDTVRF